MYRKSSRVYGSVHVLYTFVHFCILSYTFVHFFTFCTLFVHFCLFFVHFCILVYTFVHFLYTFVHFCTHFCTFCTLLYTFVYFVYTFVYLTNHRIHKQHCNTIFLLFIGACTSKQWWLIFVIDVVRTWQVHSHCGIIVCIVSFQRWT